MSKTKDGETELNPQEKDAKKAGGPLSSQLPMTSAREEDCLSLGAAAFIVGGCLPPGSHTNSDTLEETGLITAPLRQIFRECVFNGVAREGCDIDRGNIPNDATTKVGEVIIAVVENSH